MRDWAGLARDWFWSVMVAEIVEMVAGLEATEHAALIVDELEPYAGELVVGGAGMMCAGAADRYRGMLLSLLGRHDEAVAALTSALALEESVRSPTFTARTRYWLARALLARDGPGDREQATDEIDRSMETAARMGMSALVIADRDLAGAHRLIDHARGATGVMPVAPLRVPASRRARRLERSALPRPSVRERRRTRRV